MSASREIIAALVVGGMDMIDAAALVARAAVEMSGAMPTKGALRTRKWRAGQASQTVTGDAAVTQPETVTERHKPSQTVTGDNAPLSSLLPCDSKQHSEKKEKRESRATQLPSDWRPSPESWAEAVMILGSDNRAEHELKKFRNHAAEKGRVSKKWNGAWANWAIKAVEFGAQNGNGTGNYRTHQTAGPAATGDDANVAGMARALERRRAARAANDPGRQEFREERGAGTAGGPAAEPGAAAGGGGSHRQLALLPGRDRGE